MAAVEILKYIRSGYRVIGTEIQGPNATRPANENELIRIVKEANKSGMRTEMNLVHMW